MKWTDESLDQVLGELRDVELPEAALGRVRARVLAGVRPKRAWWVRWAWAPVAALALMVVMVWPRTEEVVAPPPLLAVAPAAPELRVAVPARAQVRRVTRKVVEKETEFVTLVTDDPDVVILWAMNVEGEGQ